MAQDYLQQVIEHSIINTIIGDTIGLTLETKNSKARDEIMTKNIRHTKAKLPSNQTTSMPGVMLAVMQTLKRTGIPEYNTNNETANLIGVSLGVGYYAALTKLTYEQWADLMVSAFALTKSYDRDFYAYSVLSYLIWALSDDGYFRSKHLQHAVKENLTNSELSRALNYILKHRHDKLFLSQKTLEASVFEGLTYMEKVLVKVCFYMLRVASGWFKKPRFLIEDIARYETLDLSDVLGVFSALCSTSEHLYLLYTKPLQEQVSYRADVLALCR